MQRILDGPRRYFSLRGMFALAVLFLGSPFAHLSAQPVLSFRSISVSDWPIVRLHFSVKCNGQWTRNFTRQNFRVLEDSALIGDFELFCPEQLRRCPISVALALDASGSMGGEKNFQTRTAARQFVDLMDGVDDYAAVIWFNDSDTLVQPMTNDKVLLRRAVDSLPAVGTTALWDATWSSIRELVTNGNGVDTCGAVVVLTDGNDNSSTHTLGELITYALAMHVRVITVGI
ncbi:MAG: VWA domain-containing protein, partial [Bacteroidota bacterium]|nr:VWA domain-containing protein [Bacteroidota bacterium]